MNESDVRFYEQSEQKPNAHIRFIVMESTAIFTLSFDKKHREMRSQFGIFDNKWNEEFD